VIDSNIFKKFMPMEVSRPLWEEFMADPTLGLDRRVLDNKPVFRGKTCGSDKKSDIEKQYKKGALYV